MKRRQFLKIAGTSSIIIAATGIGTYLSTRTPTAALRPWKSANSKYNDPMRRALSYAILAPNPHNRQPWQVALSSDTEATLSCDLDRLLPDTDPFNRQIIIGLGCFLESFSIAATQTGHKAQITLFPEGEPGEHLDSRPIAHLKLMKTSSISKDPLFDFTLDRHTNRNPYDTNMAIPQDSLKKIIQAGGNSVTTGATTEGSRLEILRTLSQNALRDEMLDPKAFGESIKLMRIGRTEIEANPDGLSLSGAFLETLQLLGQLSREQLADPKSESFQIGLDMADEQALTAMGFVWINTNDNSRKQQVLAGRAYMRIALRVTSLGLSMQPMSQALQEYETMQPHYQQIHTMLTKKGGERIQMLARLGYAKEVSPSPRWPLSTKIIPS